MLVATIGLHGSASTWVFNVARECLIAAFGEQQVTALYTEAAAGLPPPDGRHLVVKSHQGSPALDARLLAESARTLLSIRDPRDAAISMMQRFKVPFQQAAAGLLHDCGRLLRLAEAGHPVLRFEDRFFDDPAAAGKVADLLGLPVEPARSAAIGQRYAAATVRDFARRLGELPPTRTTMVSATHLLDKITLIHTPHIGDMRSDKWRQLPPPVQARLTQAYAPFLEHFGYPR